MQLIIVTDIFGKTTHVEEIIENISSKYTSVEIIDPYNGKEIDFRNEEDAYNHFQKEIGLEKYSKRLLNKVEGRENKSLTLIGFSIGASAIWMAAKDLTSFCDTKAICFYSSQVRNYLEINPKIFVDIYFSKTEPNYDVKEIIERLSTKQNVKCHETEYYHGFMNKKSINFSQQGYLKYLSMIDDA